MTADTETIKEKLGGLFPGHRGQTLLVCALLVFMTLCAAVILALKDGAPEKKPPEKTRRTFVPDQPLLVPPAPAVPSGYLTARQPETAWTEEETARWFSFPDEDEIRELGDANDRIVTEIVGTAP